MIKRFYTDIDYISQLSLNYDDKVGVDGITAIKNAIKPDDVMGDFTDFKIVREADIIPDSYQVINLKMIKKMVYKEIFEYDHMGFVPDINRYTSNTGFVWMKYPPDFIILAPFSYLKGSTLYIVAEVASADAKLPCCGICGKPLGYRKFNLYITEEYCNEMITEIRYCDNCQEKIMNFIDSLDI